MAVNSDPRIRTAQFVKRGVQFAEHAITMYQKRIMRSKLKALFTPGQRVTVTIRNTKYVGTVVENRWIIYTTGENGFLQVMCKWDNPAPHWRDGMFGFNQKHLKLEEE